MKLGVLFSGGKDSTYAAWLAKKAGYELGCLLTVVSKNKDSFMFHTPAIEMVEEQARLMNIPLVKQETLGIKEEELEDLEHAIKKAIPCTKVGVWVVGLEVPHAHIHLLPFTTMSELNFAKPRLSFTKEEYLEIAENIRGEF